MKWPQHSYYTINFQKGTAEASGPTLTQATQCAEALGGFDIRILSSRENTVEFTLPSSYEQKAD